MTIIVTKIERYYGLTFVIMNLFRFKAYLKTWHVCCINYLKFFEANLNLHHQIALSNIHKLVYLGLQFNFFGEKNA